MSLEEKKIRVINKEEKEYPRRLKEIPKPPEKLYILGSLPVERIPSVAVQGTARNTEDMWPPAWAACWAEKESR